MIIYIASSWKNQHAVEMLTHILRERQHNILSFIENNYDEKHSLLAENFDFEMWCNSPNSDKSFEYDTNGAMNADIVIYIAPAGKDAAAECGMAFGCGIPILGLFAKGEDFGLMRKMIQWHDRYTDLINTIIRYEKAKTK
jgi:hypothetical protein